MKLVSSVGDAVKNDIIESRGENVWFAFFFSFSRLLFSLSMSGLFCLEILGEIHFISLLCPGFPSFWKVQFLYFSFFFFFLNLYFFVGATAQHPQHTDDKETQKRKEEG